MEKVNCEICGVEIRTKAPNFYTLFGQRACSEKCMVELSKRRADAKTKEDTMSTFKKILERKRPEKTGKTRTVKAVWFEDGASPLRIHPGESLSREYLDQYSRVVEVVDIEQEEVKLWNGKFVWEDRA